MANYNSIVVVIFMLINVAVGVKGGSTIGALALDSFTFDKILEKHSQILVKFDESFAFGDKQDVFEELCNKSANVRELIIGEVQTSDYGSMKNKDMEKRFKIKKSDRPAYRLFLNHNDKPIKYKKRVTIAGLSDFLFEHIGVRLPLSYTLATFDQFAHTFMRETDAEEREAILDDAREERDALKKKRQRESADTYIKIMEKVVENGDDFVPKERNRIEKLKEKNTEKLSDQKKEAFVARLNILSAFRKFPKEKDEL